MARAVKKAQGDLRSQGIGRRVGDFDALASSASLLGPMHLLTLGRPGKLR